MAQISGWRQQDWATTYQDGSNQWMQLEEEGQAEYGYSEACSNGTYSVGYGATADATSAYASWAEVPAPSPVRYVTVGYTEYGDPICMPVNEPQVVEAQTGPAAAPASQSAPSTPAPEPVCYATVGYTKYGDPICAPVAATQAVEAPSLAVSEPATTPYATVGYTQYGDPICAPVSPPTIIAACTQPTYTVVSYGQFGDPVSVPVSSDALAVVPALPPTYPYSCVQDAAPVTETPFSASVAIPAAVPAREWVSQWVIGVASEPATVAVQAQTSASEVALSPSPVQMEVEASDPLESRVPHDDVSESPSEGGQQGGRGERRTAQSAGDHRSGSSAPVGVVDSGTYEVNLPGLLPFSLLVGQTFTDNGDGTYTLTSPASHGAATETGTARSFGLLPNSSPTYGQAVNSRNGHFFQVSALDVPFGNRFVGSVDDYWAFGFQTLEPSVEIGQVSGFEYFGTGIFPGGSSGDSDVSDSENVGVISGGARTDNDGSGSSGLMTTDEWRSQEHSGQSVSGQGYVARSGDSISKIVGSSDPQAIGNFMQANGLTNSTIIAGKNYFVPEDSYAYGDCVSLGLQALQTDNARLAIQESSGSGAAPSTLTPDQVAELYKSLGGRNGNYGASSNSVTSTIDGMPSSSAYQIVANLDERGVPQSYSAYNKLTGRIDYEIGQTGLAAFMQNSNSYYLLSQAASAPAYQVSSGQFVADALKGDFGSAALNLAKAWGQAVIDPSWWLSSAVVALGGIASLGEQGAAVATAGRTGGALTQSEAVLINGGAEVEMEAGAAARGASNVAGVHTPGAPWLDEVSNYRPGGTFLQCGDGSCVAATAQNITKGAVTESQVVQEIGEWSNAEKLAKALNEYKVGGGGWIGGMVPEDATLALASRGAIGAELQVPGQAAHMVSIEPLPGQAAILFA